MRFSPLLLLLLPVIAALLLLVGGPGTRLGLWEFSVGFLLMRWAAYLGLAAAGLALVLLLWPRTRAGQGAWLAATLLLGLGVAFLPWQLLQQARTVPPIHDITTDPLDPPNFVAILPLRAAAPNPAAYAGAEVAAQQRQAYPDLGPYRLEAGVEQAFERALATARRMGWEIVAADPAAGRIEATATSFWYGFKDDVVVRVRAEEEGSRIDLRSKSRVGRSDLGANAERIRAYLETLATPGS
jgi:uncharacterized protein (DUF1499 family)